MIYRICKWRRFRSQFQPFNNSLETVTPTLSIALAPASNPITSTPTIAPSPATISGDSPNGDEEPIYHTLVTISEDLQFHFVSTDKLEMKDVGTLIGPTLGYLDFPPIITYTVDPQLRCLLYVDFTLVKVAKQGHRVRRCGTRADSCHGTCAVLAQVRLPLWDASSGPRRKSKEGLVSRNCTEHISMKVDYHGKGIQSGQEVHDALDHLAPL
jgi:hypothetical protein